MLHPSLEARNKVVLIPEHRLSRVRQLIIREMTNKQPLPKIPKHLAEQGVRWVEVRTHCKWRKTIYLATMPLGKKHKYLCVDWDDVETFLEGGNYVTSCYENMIEIEQPKEKGELSGSEALYGFCGWLTTQKKKTVMSAVDDAAWIAQLVAIFCKTNNLTEPDDCWEKNLIHPSDLSVAESDLECECERNNRDGLIVCSHCGEGLAKFTCKSVGNSKKYCSWECMEGFELSKKKTPYTASNFPCWAVWIRTKSLKNNVAIQKWDDRGVYFSDDGSIADFREYNDYLIASSIPDEEGNIVWRPFYTLINK